MLVESYFICSYLYFNTKLGKRLILIKKAWLILIL